MSYTDQLKEFQKYMLACLDVLTGDGATCEMNDIFYNSDFEITFRGKSVKLGMGADVFQTIDELIQREIDENEGF